MNSVGMSREANRSGGRGREGEAPAEPLLRLERLPWLAARQELRPPGTNIQSVIFARCGSVARIVAVSSSPATSGAFSSHTIVRW